MKNNKLHKLHIILLNNNAHVKRVKLHMLLFDRGFVCYRPYKIDLFRSNPRDKYTITSRLANE